MSFQRTIGPVTRHAKAWPAPDPLAAEASVRFKKEEMMTKIKCPSCENKLLVDHGESSTCVHCGASFSCAGNALETKVVLTLSDFTVEPSIVSGAIANGTDSKVECVPRATGAIRCPYCSVVQLEPQHGESKVCSTCGLEMIVHGNGLTVSATLLVSDHRVE